ncbi:ATP-dependent DNA helicase RecG [Candidatus Kinetoplastibacterium desouzaii TCC079E]|uniref:ATP-dependent DNA helicase RecG n=1 Tax=Candidatus Kinetoplastidibacterium desouzai TCC079E TaxID=1208919 RepID=M1M3T3_9PROT|nr:ATP-dependent DNA helicase RecG [Candidatus Kinetoplastibacterium desouzaii]AGF46905.1 ATP-dependent DNA helicase RecG [Candidatus Kinetoplastibacterium desouzaii TCC079E]
MEKKSEKSFNNNLLKLGLNEKDDFLLHIPLRYNNETFITKIANIQLSKYIVVEGLVTDVKVLDSKFNKKYLVVTINDNTGFLELRWINFFYSLMKELSIGSKIRVGGEVGKWKLNLEMIHPKIYNCKINLPKNLTPIYSSVKGLSQTKIRKLISNILLEEIEETVPNYITRKYSLMKFDESIRFLHNPPPNSSLDLLIEKKHPAWIRIKFDELLAHQLSIELIRQNRIEKKAHPLHKNTNYSRRIDVFLKSLGFQLTEAQKKTSNEISKDLSQDFPMNRLLQGDVGSGKTIVAVIAAIQTISCNKQVALMTPTEILSEQHFSNIKKWFKNLDIRLEVITSAKSVKEKRIIKDNVLNGNIQFIIGTQSLIQDHIHFKNLGLSIIDEQHRFGVEQRFALYNKGILIDDGKEIYPHLLSMSATPIPRTLAMTYLADMDISIINQMPNNRKPIITKLISYDRREELLMYIANSVRNGSQAYWVCPLIDESKKIDLQNAVNTFDYIKGKFPDLNIGLIHSNLSNSIKIEIMKDFRNGIIDLLVSTTVIEVGVDVPKASMIIIEHSERFGLAQLHQLRGRVGRGDIQSICVLLYQNPLSYIAKKRLKAMFETLDGFKIAKYDLQIRGPGDFLGTKQSGVNILRFSDIEQDKDIYEQAKEAAYMIKKDNPEYIDTHIKRWKRISSVMLDI